MVVRKKFSDLDSYPATKIALKSKLGITNLEENQYSGVVVYSTYAELPITGTLLVSYKVSNDPNTALNGYYHWSGSAYVKDAHFANNPDDIDLETKAGNVIGLKDRSNYLFVRDTFDWTADLSAYEGFILEIRNGHDVGGGNITLADNITLFFNGGNISNVGTFTGSNTKISSDGRQIFNSITSFTGTWDLEECFCEWFGAVGDGVTDDSQALIDAMEVLRNTGGCVKFKAKRYLIAQQITLPDNEAVTTPKLAPLIWEGVGSMHTGRGTAPIGGTILDLTYNDPSNKYGKIMCLGLGLWEIKGITFTDSSSSSTAFIYDTNTTILAYNNGFYGNKGGALADQDAFIMGGTEDVEGFRGLDDGFQGYGTVIQSNYFGRIRRALYGRVFFNGTIFSNNTIWNTCGGDSCIEIDGDPDDKTVQKATGNVISGNLIEATNYVTPIKLRETEKNTFISNNFYDPTVTTQSFYFLDPTAKFNYILAGFNPDTIDLVNTYFDNTIINTHQNEESTYVTPQRMYEHLYIQGTGVSVDKLRLVNINNQEYFKRMTDYGRVFSVFKTELGVEVQADELRDFGGGVIQHLLRGTDARFEGQGTVRVRSGGALSELYLGDSTRTNIYIIDGILYTNRDGGVTQFQDVRASTTGSRPTGKPVGFMYFDTTLQIPIWHSGGNIWKNASGNIV